MCRELCSCALGGPTWRQRRSTGGRLLHARRRHLSFPQLSEQVLQRPSPPAVASSPPTRPCAAPGGLLGLSLPRYAINCAQ